MPYEVTYDSERDCIVTRIDGRLDIPVAKEFLAEIARVISTCGCKRILHDLRGAELTLRMGELYFAPQLVSQAGIPRTIKSAVIVAEKDRALLGARIELVKPSHLVRTILQRTGLTNVLKIRD